MKRMTEGQFRKVAEIQSKTGKKFNFKIDDLNKFINENSDRATSKAFESPVTKIK